MAIIHTKTLRYITKNCEDKLYPKNVKSDEMLSFYAQHFRIVEINSKYYAIPKPNYFEGIAEDTSNDSHFKVIIHNGMTYGINYNKSVFDQFEEAIQPLVEAKRSNGVLMKSPKAFENIQGNLFNQHKEIMSKYQLIKR
ncbi:MAG: hypothetical protein QG641_2904 [Candidatus Poribacteria bacterium]|nr:hypothetical protein [Candidatus Poribacteria bacterium]